MNDNEIYKILEQLIDRCRNCKFATCEQCEISYTEVQAIDALINKYKNLQVKYKDIWSIDNHIPKID